MVGRNAAATRTNLGESVGDRCEIEKNAANYMPGKRLGLKECREMPG